MITRESLTDNPEEVEYLIRWWLVQDKYRYHRMMVRGTKEDFINDVWVRLFESFPEGKSVPYYLATVVINTCRWELFPAIRRSGLANEFEFKYRIRGARQLRPSDSVEDGEQVIVEHIQLQQLDIAIAHVLRTLTFREAVIIRARYGLLGDKALSLDEVARVLKVTRERIRQIEMKGIKKIQHHSRARNLIPFLESTINGDSEP